MQNHPPSLSETYVNFGIMQLYNDTSLDEMLAVFFRILGTREFSQIRELKKGVRVILTKIEAIVMTRPNKLDDTRLLLVTPFIGQMLLWPDKSKFETKRNPNQNCFRVACRFRLGALLPSWISVLIRSTKSLTLSQDRYVTASRWTAGSFRDYTRASTSSIAATFRQSSKRHFASSAL
jgi:hypothetical protein